MVTTSARGSGAECFRRNLSPRGRPESRFGWTEILCIASFEWRKNPAARPGIKLSAMQLREYLDGNVPQFEDTLRRNH
jgi:hypothetical protein